MAGERVAVEQHHRGGGDEADQLDVVVAALREIAEAHGRVGEPPTKSARRYAVPPTVNPSILSVGTPTPTGTLWPSLPQVPMPLSSSISLPTIDTRVKASGPLPISVAPFTG